VANERNHTALDALQLLDGADVANAIETLGLRLRNEGFADGTVRSMTPSLPPAVGYAVTARIRCSSPPAVGQQYIDRTDWWNHLLQVPAPRFVVVQDVDEHTGLGAFLGEVHANVLRALGCAGYATNGAVRDLAALTALRFPTFASCTSVSHAFAHVVDFGSPVAIGGLFISSGDVLFADASGLQSIPPAVIDRLPAMVADIRRRDEEVIRFCRSADFSIDGLRTLLRTLG
jgi:regulator of RNase E activity RraA